MMDKLEHCRHVEAFKEEDWETGEGEWEEEAFYFVVDAEIGHNTVVKRARHYEITGWPEKPLMRLEDQIYALEARRLVGTELIFEAGRNDKDDANDFACIASTSDRFILKPVTLYKNGQGPINDLQNHESNQPPIVPAPHPAFRDDLERWQEVQESIERSHRAIERIRARQRKKTLAQTAAAERDKTPVYAPTQNTEVLFSALTEGAKR